MKQGSQVMKLFGKSMLWITLSMSFFILQASAGWDELQKTFESAKPAQPEDFKGNWICTYLDGSYNYVTTEGYSGAAINRQVVFERKGDTVRVVYSKLEELKDATFTLANVIDQDQQMVGNLSWAKTDYWNLNSRTFSSFPIVKQPSKGRLLMFLESVFPPSNEEIQYYGPYIDCTRK